MRTELLVDASSALEKIGELGSECNQRLLHVIQYANNGIPPNDVRFSPFQCPRVISFPGGKQASDSIMWLSYFTPQKYLSFSLGVHAEKSKEREIDDASRRTNARDRNVLTYSAVPVRRSEIWLRDRAGFPPLFYT
jgi:hypothetical protein